MKNYFSHYFSLLWIVILTFIITFLAMLSLFLSFFYDSWVHDLVTQPQCFVAIDNWYKEKSLAVNYNKRWAQHLECEANFGLFPWGKDPKFSENPPEKYYKKI